MADWSQLPKDLLQEILTSLDSPIYTLRLRSICSNWRDGVSSNGHIHTSQYLSLSSNPIFNNLSLSKRSILLLSPPSTSNFPNPRPWIIKIEEINPQSFNLFHPLAKNRINPLSNFFPRSLNLLNVRIRELGIEFSIQKGGILGDCSLYAEKIAFLPVKNSGGNNFLLSTTHVSGKLAIFSSIDMKWTLVNQIQSPYDDVIAYNGEFYAVDNLGRTFVLIDDNVSMIAELVCGPVCGGDKKRLVEMCGQLMLVDIYIGVPPLYDDRINGYDNDDYYDYDVMLGDRGRGDKDDDQIGDSNVSSLYIDEFMSKSMWFHVYRLDREMMKWVEVKDLGNNVLFLSLNSTFAASADDLLWDKGNCICFNFADLFSSWLGVDYDHARKHNSYAVYNLKDSSISSSTLLLSPPTWITSACV